MVERLSSSCAVLRFNSKHSKRHENREGREGGMEGRKTGQEGRRKEEEKEEREDISVSGWKGKEKHSSVMVSQLDTT